MATLQYPARIYGPLDPRALLYGWTYRPLTEDEIAVSNGLAALPSYVEQATEWDARLTEAEARGADPAQISRGREALAELVANIAKLNKYGRDLIDTVTGLTGQAFGAEIRNVGLSGFDWNKVLAGGLCIIGALIAGALFCFTVVEATGILLLAAGAVLAIGASSAVIGLVLVAVGDHDDGTAGPGSVARKNLPSFSSFGTVALIGLGLVVLAPLFGKKGPSHG